MASGIQINFRCPAQMASEYRETIKRIQQIAPDLRPQVIHATCISLFLSMKDDKARLEAIGESLKYPLKSAIKTKKVKPS